MDEKKLQEVLRTAQGNCMSLLRAFPLMKDTDGKKIMLVQLKTILLAAASEVQSLFDAVPAPKKQAKE